MTTPRDGTSPAARAPILDGAFADMVLQFRGRTGLSQRAVADDLRIHVRSVQLWEAGESHPNARNLQALIGVFFDAGAFTAGLVQTEAAALWHAAEAVVSEADGTDFFELTQAVSEVDDVCLHARIGEG